MGLPLLDLDLAISVRVHAFGSTGTVFARLTAGTTDLAGITREAAGSSSQREHVINLRYLSLTQHSLSWVSSAWLNRSSEEKAA